MDQTPPGSEPFRQLRLTDATFDHRHHLPGTAPGLPWNPGATDHRDHQPRCGGNLGVEATSNPLQAPRVMVLLEDLLISLQTCETDLGTYEGGLFDL